MSKKILLVEDEALIAMNEAQMLKKHGYEVVTAYNGEKAIEAVVSDPDISLILMDIDLGKGIDGPEAAERILATHDLPIVFLTSHSEKEYVDRVKKITNYGYVLKNSGEFVLLESIYMAYTLFEEKEEKRDLYDNAPCGYHSLDKDGVFTSINNTELSWLGYTRSEIIGKKKFSDIITTDSRETYKKNFPVFKERGWVYDLEFEMIRKDGTILPVLLNATSVKNLAGNYLMSRSTIIDITKRKQTEEQLKERVKELNCLYKISKIVEEPNSTLDGILQKTADTVPVSWQYPEIAVCRITLYGKEYRSHGFRVTDLLQSSALHVNGNNAGSVEVYYLEERPTCNEGSFLKEERQLIDAVSERLGKIIERKITEEKLQENEKRYRTIVENINDALIIHDFDGIINFLNDKTCRMLNYSRDELIGKSIVSLHSYAYRDFIQNIIENAAWLDRDIHEIEALSKDGKVIPVEIRSKIVSKDGAGEIQSVARDITERKQAEEAINEANLRLTTVIDSIDAFVYIADMETYEIIFTNEYGREMFGDIAGQKCFKAIQGQDGSCSFCTNDKLVDKDGNPTGIFAWEHYNTLNRRWGDCRDSALQWHDGRMVRIEVATDITERKYAEKLLKERNATLHEINQYSIELSFLRYDELYPYIVKKLKDIFKTSTAWVSEYDENTSQMVVKSTSLSDEDNSWVMKKLGEKVIGYSVRLYEDQREMMKNVQAGNPQTLHEVSFGAIPENIAKLIEKKLNLVWFMTVAFINRDKITGTAVIAGKPGEEAPDRELLLAFADITGEVIRRKRAEEELKEKKELLQHITVNMFDLVALTDIDGTYTFISKSHSGLGYDINNLLGKNVFDFVHPEDITRVETSFKEIMQSDETERKEEFRYRCADGSYILVESIGKKLFGEDGEIKELIFSARNITERKRAEEQAQELQERLRKIIDNSPLSIIEIDAGGHYVLANEATCALLNTTKEELIGKHFEEVVLPETALVYKERINLVSETGEMMTVDDTLHIDRQEQIVRTVLFPIYRHGESLPSIIGVTYEITKELRLLREKDFLMKELNHRVKNNLLMVSSLINLKDSETEADLSDIQQQVEAIGLIHEKLYQTGNVTEVCIRDYFDDLLTSIFSSFSRRPVKVEANIDEISIPTKSAMSLGLIINEIATNAIKHGFNEKEEAVFLIKMKKDKENNKYELTLSNTGKPFPKEIDIENTDTLGLRLISALVGQIDGTLELQKRPYPVFTIRFPIEEE